MISSTQWGSLLHLKPADFHYPDNMDFSIVQALDQFITFVGSRPQILDDFRFDIGGGNPNSQHLKGKAIDTTWPGRSPADINAQAIASRLFSGIGVYVNDAGVASHHFDTRTSATPANPAVWGGVITHPLDTNTGEHLKRTEYTTMDKVLDMIKKKWYISTPALIVSVVILYLLIRRH